MPYFITDSSPDCSGWATVKEDGEVIGCHTTKQDAIDQMVAVSIAEEIEPGGERLKKKNKMKKTDYRVLPDNYRPSLSEDVPEGRACGNCVFYIESDVKKFAGGELRAWCEKWDDYVNGAYYCNAWQPTDEDEEELEEELEEVRQVNLTPPAYMRAAARRGLELNRQGFGGDGLTDKTKQEARDMAAGRVSEDKWRRIAPWIARHLVDLDAPKNNNPDDPDYPGAGLVAHLLWGSGPSKRAAQRTLDYAQGVINRLDAEENKARYSSINVNLNKEDKETQVNKVERRVKTDVDFELRVEATESDGMRFTGYAAVFNSNSEPLPFIERIMPGAFKRSLKSRNEVKLFKNHNMDEVLASTRSKTLRLSEDSKGLLAEATLPDTTAGRDLAVLMKRGDVHAMSFGFSVPSRGDSWSDDGMTRELKEIRLHEVSIVTGFPAYEATTASVRSLDILATRTNVDVDALADALTKLESGEKLPDSQADLLQEVVTKLRENTPSPDELLEIKRKQIDLLYKAV
jgi:HK97 family phage prohead protease